jgi:hypothetical protein
VHAWLVPLQSTRPSPPTSEVGWFERTKLPAKAELRAAGRERALQKQAEAEAPAALKRRRLEAQVEAEAALLLPLAAADRPNGKRRRSAIAAAVLHEDIDVIIPGPI